VSRPDGRTDEAGAPADAPMYHAIETKVRAALHPTHLEVTDESYMHAVPEGAESHFRLLVVSEQFAGKTAVQRHQAVYAVLAEELKNHIHALGLQTMTPAEWAEDEARNSSPECLGGSKVEA
jgi:BolA protein